MASTFASEASSAWEWAATGTRWRVYHSGGVDAERAAIVRTQVEADEARWSRFREDSEVAAVNRGAGSEVVVSRATIELLAACAYCHGRSGGVFQPLVGAAVRAWGYDVSIAEEQPYAAVSPRAEPLGGLLALDIAAQTVRIPRGTQLDLGGIAKGWMAARAGEALAGACDDPSLLVDAGGDLVAVRGAHRVAIETHGAPDTPALWLRAGESIATSGHGRRRWRNGDGVEAHHLIDPETGSPAAPAHATVVAESGAAADVGAKVLALRPATLADLQLPARVTSAGGEYANDAWLERVS